MKALDFSNARLDVVKLQAAGLGVIRYLGPPSWPKALTSLEAVNYAFHGVPCAVNWESSGRSWRGGYSVGFSEGQRARSYARAAGVKDDRWIYQSADEDVPTFLFGLLGEYQRGFNDGGGCGPQAFYGPAGAGRYLFSRGLIVAFWQTNARAWNGNGTDSEQAALIQRTSHSFPQFPAGAYDENDVMRSDWGQTPKPVPPKPPTPAPGPPPITKVKPMYSPALVLPPIAASCACPTGGCWLVADDGAVFAFGGAPYEGGANGQAYFKGKHAAEIRPWKDGDPGVAGKPRGTYVIISTENNPYAY